MSTATKSMPQAIPVAKPWIGLEEESAVLEVLRSGWLSQGPRVLEFERRFAQYVGAAHALAVSSCTTALHMAMFAVGVGEGDEVICPSLSFIATANAIRYAGAIPVFADIDPVTYNLDPSSVAAAITPRTKAVMVVHQVGMPAPMDEINAIARDHGIQVIEDAACAIGSTYKNELIGKPHSPIACFSFHPRKVLTTGEGGMITTNDEQIANRLRPLRQHAMSVSDLARHSASQLPAETYDEVGYNYRMTDLQAAVGIVQLNRMPEFLSKRRMLAARYTDALNRLGWLAAPEQPAYAESNYQSYMARLRPDAPGTREELIQFLLDRGISTRRGVMAIHRQKPYQNAPGSDRLPQTEAISDETIILPLSHAMTDEQQAYVTESLQDFS